MFKLESTPLPLQYTSVRSNLVPLPYSACIWTHCQHACSLFWNSCVYSLRPICICLLSEATGAPLVSISLVCMCLSDANLSLLGSTSPPALASTVFFFSSASQVVPSWTIFIVWWLDLIFGKEGWACDRKHVQRVKIHQFSHPILTRTICAQLLIYWNFTISMARAHSMQRPAVRRSTRLAINSSQSAAPPANNPSGRSPSPASSLTTCKYYWYQ